MLCLTGAPAFAGNVLPTGGSVASGGVNVVQPNATTLNVNQSTNQAIINWNTFSVGRGDTVNFKQPGASSSTLNRVTSSTPSWIAGVINAPGTVLLVNPNGIEITKSGTINTGSFAASTLNIKDSDYLSGNYSFSGNGASAGVINNGRINVSDGGFAALLGGQVANNGVIAARLGFVALGAGEMATLDLSGDGFLSVAVPSSQLGNLVNAHGALVSNKGKILANGGTVFLSAATASNILRNAVNSGGLIRANSVGVHNGRIVINGGGGNVRVTGRIVAGGGRKHKGGTVTILGKSIKISGRISANGKNGGSVSVVGTGDLFLSGTIAVEGLLGAGGEANLTGSNVSLVAATINASGAFGGGDINIGGGPHATAPLADAQSLSIDSATVIKADATKKGNGGHIVAWSGGQTAVSGSLSATGGPNGGNGGTIETSGQVLNVAGITVNASAAHGQDGNWLLDPTDLIIDATLATEIDTTLSGGTGVTLQTSATGNPTTPYTLTAGESNASGTGSIDVNSAIAWTSGAALTLSAYNNIAVGANITSTGGGAVTLHADNTGTGSGTVSFSGGAKIATSGGTGPKTVTIFYNPTGNNNSTVNSTSYTTPTSYSTDVTSGKGTLTAYMLVNTVYDLQNMQNNLSGAYALGTNINASATSGWTSGGFVPIGLTSYFTGTFNGEGYTISNLTIDQPTGATVGLFGEIFGASSTTVVVQNVGLVGGSVTGLDDVGGLVGYLSQGTISQSYSQATVTALNPGYPGTAGGLVGLNYGTISASFATGNVTGYNDAALGGLAGENAGTISNAYATGSVTQLNSNGGNPNGTASIGGLVGYNEGNISYSYATGALSASNPSDSGNGSNGYNLGGLVGDQASHTITASYFDNQTTGTSSAFGYNTNSQTATGESTATLQAALPGSWSTSIWTIQAGQTFPYFTWYTPTVSYTISGTVYLTYGGTAAVGAGVSVYDLVNGTALVSSVQTNASGQYTFTLSSALSAGSQVIAYVGSGTSGGVAFQESASGSVSGLNIYETYVAQNAASSSTSLSTVTSDFATAKGANTIPTPGNMAVNIAAASFAINQAVSTGTLVLSSTGTVTQSAAITATT
ncbi:MAG: filamentous hemagglutinin N-terminal domain-containing protein, partial [Xanthobacteraceae bacterium]